MRVPRRRRSPLRAHRRARSAVELEVGDYLIHFVSRLDPNGNTGNTSVAWPRYSTDSPRLLTLLDDAHEPVALTEDTFRFDGLELMQDLTLRSPSDRVPAPYIHV